MLSLFKYTFATRSWPAWARYLATLVIITGMLGLRLATQGQIPGTPYLFFFLGIIVASALFNHGTGVFAVLLSAALAKWFLIEPTGTLDVAGPHEIVGLSIFVAVGIITAGILETLHRIASDLISANRHLIVAEREKDLLLQEASHRFKNEITMLTALLRLQAHAIPDEAARSALSATADRVQVLGRVHERLQRANQSVVVDMRAFITALCDDLRTALIGLRPIALKVEVEHLCVPQESAVPIGLIINELLTNALKYAFPDDRAGTVSIRLTRDREEFCLRVADDGVGMAFEHKTEGSGLGQRLVRSMAAQLQGTITIEPDAGAPGTIATVRFPATS